MSRRVVSRVLREGQKDDGAFDLAFWQAQGAAAIVAAGWDMVNEARIWQGQHGDEPRLQRSVVRVVRRAG